MHVPVGHIHPTNYIFIDLRLEQSYISNKIIRIDVGHQDDAKHKRKYVTVDKGIARMLVNNLKQIQGNNSKGQF